jgi:hypothetical protein
MQSFWNSLDLSDLGDRKSWGPPITSVPIPPNIFEWCVYIFNVITIYSNIFIFMTVTNNIYQKQIKYHVFNAATNSELTELVPVFKIWPVFLTSVTVWHCLALKQFYIKNHYTSDFLCKIVLKPSKSPAKIQRVQQKIPGCWTYVQQNENKFQKLPQTLKNCPDLKQNF